MMMQERPRATPAAQGKEEDRDELWLNRCPGGGGEGDGGGGGGQELQIPGGGGLGDGGGGVPAAEDARRTHSRTRILQIEAGEQV